MTRTKRHSLLLAAALFAPLSSAGASEALHILDPYVRAVPAGLDQTAAYLTLRNGGQKNLTLTQAASPAARAIELHTVVDEGGLKKMRPVPKIDIPAGGEVRLQPGGLHIMLIGLRAPLTEGASVALTLTFQDGSRREVSAPVRAIGSTLPMMHHGH
jgi:copper(I)-binding protein